MDAGELLCAQRVVPVVVIDDAEQAVPLAEALHAAGLGAVEITLRTNAALDAIARVARAMPDMLTGAGSIRSVAQLRQASNAGAHFCVSPGSTAPLLAAAADGGIPLVPGAATATEVMRLLDAGYRLQKFFPASLSGGVSALRALGAPLPEARFFPTGGIARASAADYLALSNVLCIGGTWIAPRELLAAGDFDEIRCRAADAAALLL
ncbi:MAG TPA: bifunctional 4-hydroxy-2-oxoglutarate aldolase/2-dehydro-3-deoxy-phosphogluconate aldolase [Woeseiaceae bacterium]|nr:bifunctional 4-hydroxy-2-oxoglutarate aldolase/2-dehydro-3-deoxy-phosphogluconate aldolase [Woeseiaceae bacterium]